MLVLAIGRGGLGGRGVRGLLGRTAQGVLLRCLVHQAGQDDIVLQYILLGNFIFITIGLTVYNIY